MDLKTYQINDHLGNVRVVVYGRKLSILNNVTRVFEDFESEILMTSMYYPFGSIMPNSAQNLGAGTYRYGMNGMEQDKEWTSNGGSHYTSYWRQYDPRLGRWMSDEPKPVAYESGYAAFRNNPISYADPSGDWPKWLGGGKGGFKTKGKRYKKNHTEVKGVDKSRASAEKPRSRTINRSETRSFELSFDNTSSLPGRGPGLSPIGSTLGSIVSTIGAFTNGTVSTTNYIIGLINSPNATNINSTIDLKMIETPFVNDAKGTTTYNMNVAGNLFTPSGGDAPQRFGIGNTPLNLMDIASVNVVKTPGIGQNMIDACTSYKIQVRVITTFQQINGNPEKVFRIASLKGNKDFGRDFRPNILGRYGISRWWWDNYEIRDENGIKLNRPWYIGK